MFFALSKVLFFLLNPLNWIVLLLLGALFFRRKRWKRRCLRTALGVAVVFSNPLLFDQLVGVWEMETVEKSALNETYDVAIVLGGYTEFQQKRALNSYNFSESVDRITTAVELYQTGQVKHILLSGGSGKLLEEEPSEAQAMQQFLRKLNMPDTAVWADPTSRNTRANALHSKALLDEKMPDARCLLITSAIHMPRAKACFEKVNLEVDYLSVDYLQAPQKWLPVNTILPSTEVMDDWQRLLKEWVGYVVYKMQGYA